MKTLRLSSIALLFLCIYSSCTKSVTTIDSQTQTSKAGGPSGISGGGKVNPSLIVFFNPSPAIQNQTTTVTGTFDATTGVAIPDCGALHLFQMVNGAWVHVASATITSSVHEVNYNFVPTTVGTAVYEFRVQYVPSSGCSDFSENFSSNYFLDVISACQGLTIKGIASATPTSEAGIYLFTVSYTVNTCGIEFTHLKTQGGLTAWTTDVQEATAGYVDWLAGNSSHPNTIIKWEENSQLPGNTKTYTVSFKKAWSGSGPVELTGQWSVTADVNGSQTATATFDPITYQ